MKNKKGVSPLLAAVLLIAFSIVLAAIVSNFVIKKTKEFKPDVIAEESVYCDTVSLGYEIDTTPGNYDIDNSIQGVTLINGIILVNKGTFSIHQLLINTPGVQSVQIKLDSEIKPQGNYPIKLQVGSSPEVKIIPIIKDSDTGNFVKCSNKELIINLYGLSGGNVELVKQAETGSVKIGDQDLLTTEDEDVDGLTNLDEIILGLDPIKTNMVKDADNTEILPPDANSNGIEDTTEINVMTEVIGITSTAQPMPTSGNENSPKSPN